MTTNPTERPDERPGRQEADHSARHRGGDGGGEPEPVMVLMRFQTDRPDDLAAVLARYVVLTRGQPGCRNIDLVASAVVDGRFVVVQKWDSIEAQRAHFDSPQMVEMAKESTPLLNREPDIDLLEGISMHDLA